MNVEKSANKKIEPTTKAEPIFCKFKILGGFCVSSSLALYNRTPGNKLPGYFQMFLRDRIRICLTCGYVHNQAQFKKLSRFTLVAIIN